VLLPAARRCCWPTMTSIVHHRGAQTHLSVVVCWGVLGRPVGRVAEVGRLQVRRSFSGVRRSVGRVVLSSALIGVLPDRLVSPLYALGEGAHALQKGLLQGERARLGCCCLSGVSGWREAAIRSRTTITITTLVSLSLSAAGRHEDHLVKGLLRAMVTVIPLWCCTECGHFRGRHTARWRRIDASLACVVCVASRQ